MITCFRYIMLSVALCCFFAAMPLVFAQKNANDNDVIDKYDLFKIVQRKIPNNWLIAQREDKPGQIYFAISRTDASLVRSEVSYTGEASQEETWAKKNGNTLPYEIHITFESYSYEAYKAAKGGTTAVVEAPIAKKTLADLEDKLGMKEMAFDKDAGTYAAFSKDDKNKLVNFLLTKEYYSGQPQVVYSNVELPTYYVKDNIVTIKFKYPREEFRVYPKQIADEAERIEQIIKDALQPK